jgi:phage head maturation protease
MTARVSDLRSAAKAEELSLDEIDQQIWRLLNPDPERPAGMDYASNIKVYDDHIRYEKGGSVWMCDYTVQDGKIVLGEAIEGQLVFQPLAQKATTAIKSLGNGKVGGYLMVWGNPTLKDLENTYFAPDTELCLDWFPQRPILYEHGQDGALKQSPMGQFTTVDMKADEVGMWIEGQLDARKRYLAAVEKLMAMGALNWSSRSLPDLMEIAPDGKITKWPLIEATMTTHPAELRFTDVQSMKAFFQEAGLELPQELIAGAQGVADAGASGQASGVELRKRRLRLLASGLKTSKGA